MQFLSGARRFAACFGCSFALTLACAGALAAQGNDQFAPTGGRSTLMGGTGVALGRDGATPFVNPAAIVRILDRRLAFSVHFYSLEFMRFSDFHRPGDVDTATFGEPGLRGTSLASSSFRTLPSTLCLFFTLAQLAQLSGAEPRPRPSESAPRSKLALCLASLESEDVDLEALRFSGATATGRTSQVQALQRRWSRHFVGPTYSTYLTQDLAIGGSVQAVYSHNAFGFDSATLSNKLSGGSIRSDFGASGSGHSFDLTALVGATFRLGDWTIGASLRAPSVHLFGSYIGTFHRSTSGADEDIAIAASGEGSMRSALPIRAAAGVGVTWGPWTLELDGALNIPIADELVSEVDEAQSRSEGADAALTETKSRARYRVPSRVTWNPSFGAEYYLNPALSLLAGVSSNFSSLRSLRPVASVGNLAQARSDHLSASFGLGSYWNGGELLFGLQFDYGWGESLAVNPYAVPNDWSVVGMQTYALTFVISGATDLNAILRTVDNLTGSDAPPAQPEPKPAAAPPATRP